jgi:hypothetical protein
MQRSKILLVVLFTGFLPLSLLNGQEKKIERKIKVFVDDKSGSKVIIDTTFSGNHSIDSVRLKDGSMVFIGHENTELQHDPASVKKHIFITSDDKNPGGEKIREITVISTDSLDWQEFQGNDHSDKFNVNVSDEDIDQNTDMAKYVIAKNGIVVSIEGNDEAKIKELIKIIEAKLDVKNDETTEKQEVRNSNKPREKKK